MFSFAKKPAQEVTLNELSEEQLTQVAGGKACDHDWDDKKKKKHHHKHEGHHSSHSSHSSHSTSHHHHYSHDND
jgi:hypothetical protein